MYIYVYVYVRVFLAFFFTLWFVAAAALLPRLLSVARPHETSSTLSLLPILFSCNNNNKNESLFFP